MILAVHMAIGCHTFTSYWVVCCSLALGHIGSSELETVCESTPRGSSQIRLSIIVMGSGEWIHNRLEVRGVCVHTLPLFSLCGQYTICTSSCIV